jgi:hypothetical protein
MAPPIECPTATTGPAPSILEQAHKVASEPARGVLPGQCASPVAPIVGRDDPIVTGERAELPTPVVGVASPTVDQQVGRVPDPLVGIEEGAVHMGKGHACSPGALPASWTDTGVDLI